MTQKGQIQVLIIALVVGLLAIGGYLVYQNQPKPAPSSQPTTQPSSSPSDETTNKVSRSGTYIITENMLGDYNKISITDSQGNIIIDDLVAKNEKEIGYNVKFRCQCGTSFKEWVSDSQFIIKIVNGGGEEYEYIVEAKTGTVNEATFKRVQ